MAVSTTQSIWRSGGGDQTRTSYCGSGMMAAEFYIADASVATATKVAVDSTLLTTYLVLPAGAVVTGVVINDAGTGSIDLGTLGVVSGTATGASIANNLTVSSLGVITSGLTLTAISELSYVTVTIDTSGAGTVGGYITYFVVDPLYGQQNV
jgi:nitrous oxidase accessory protein NosD